MSGRAWARIAGCLGLLMFVVGGSLVAQRPAGPPAIRVDSVYDEIRDLSLLEPRGVDVELARTAMPNTARGRDGKPVMVSLAPLWACAPNRPCDLPSFIRLRFAITVSRAAAGPAPALDSPEAVDALETLESILHEERIAWLVRAANGETFRGRLGPQCCAKKALTVAPGTGSRVLQVDCLTPAPARTAVLPDAMELLVSYGVVRAAPDRAGPALVRRAYQRLVVDRTPAP